MYRNTVTQVKDFLVPGFTFGFRIGFSGSMSSGKDRNNLSAFKHNSSVSASILKELCRGHTTGPFHVPPFSFLHCSPLGAVPKKDNTIRLIHDLSAPAGFSVNEGIPPEMFSVRYSSFDSAASLVRDMGKGCFMAKVDIKHAFRSSRRLAIVRIQVVG